MDTAHLIDSLATDLHPVSREATAPLLARAVGVGGVASLGLVLLVYGVQPGLTGVGAEPFVMKSLYAVALGAVALAAAARLMRPDGKRGDARLLLIPVAALGALAARRLTQTPPDSLGEAVLGGSWDRCPWRIAALSLPVTGALLLAARRHAPTALRRTGAAIGLAGGATAAVAYALACTESSPSFVLIWYTLGLALASGVGALLGPRVLRW